MLPDRYRILERLGAGAAGIVYRAYDRDTDEVVALKVLRAEVAADPASLDRFKNELRLARRVTHKNVCRIYDLSRTPAHVFISMEYVAGESLRRVLERSPRIPPAQAIAITLQVCAGLQEIHALGIVHRDLKPENLFVDSAAVAKIMDFGISRLAGAHTTQMGIIVGTPAYMAPEQVESRSIDPRTDIYALGVVCSTRC